MTDIKDNLLAVKGSLPKGVNLVAVSKFHPKEVLKEAYDAGQRIFGESRAQELVEKAVALPTDIQWHFIGHLQTNKIRMILPYVSLIHSVDSFKLLKAINDDAKKLDKVIAVLLQLHVAKEETKFGLTEEECLELVDAYINTSQFGNVRVRGVMGMATNTDDETQIREDFRTIRNIFSKLKSGPLSSHHEFSEISMGMSGDYPIAIEEGATMVRIGSKIFGQRQY